VPRAFAGITVPNFPNLFIMYGPGTNGGEIVSMLMQQGRYIVRCVKRMTRTGATALEVKQFWADAYDLWLQSKVNATVWATNHNYYKVESGRVVTQWPLSPLTYAAIVHASGRASLRVGFNKRR
jgi:cation diffusion facilitator CzcD-associated flavoprotein CzcO